MEDEPAPDEPQVSDVDDDDLEQDEWEDDDFFVHDEEPLERPLVDVLKDLPTSPEASSADSRVRGRRRILCGRRILGGFRGRLRRRRRERRRER